MVGRLMLACFMPMAVLPAATGYAQYKASEDASADQEDKRVRLIFDTDMDTDCDDAGALALLHALADRGEVEILATLVSSHYRWSAPCVEAINRYYGRGDLPIGSPKGKGAGTDRGSRYAKQIAQEYQTRLKTNDDAPDAVAVYREALAEQPDESVVVVTVGYATNLRDLLASQPDENSELDGEELVGRKVRLWVCMGGRYPAHRDPQVYGNFKPDPESAVAAAREWPTPIVFSGLGQDILTGRSLRGTPEDNPVRRIYELYLGEKPARPSWDPIAVLYAVRPHADFWKVRSDGYNHIFPNGTNEWRDEPDDARHRLLLLPDGAKDNVRKTIERLMAQAPATAAAGERPNIVILVADDLGWDGRDIWPVLTGDVSDPPSRVLYWLGPRSRSAAIREGDWKLVVHQGKADEEVKLFDLGNDRRERHDLAAQQRDQVERLRRLLDREGARDNDAVVGQ